jgi:hypothetical protein
VQLTVRDALNSALDEEMVRDDSVFIMGEEVSAVIVVLLTTVSLLSKVGACAVTRVGCCAVFVQLTKHIATGLVRNDAFLPGAEFSDQHCPNKIDATLNPAPDMLQVGEYQGAYKVCLAPLFLGRTPS